MVGWLAALYNGCQLNGGGAAGLAFDNKPAHAIFLRHGETDPQESAGAYAAHFEQLLKLSLTLR